MTALTLQNLVKHYHGRKVVDAVSLDLKNGEVVGLLGPNGAGKTTTFYMAVGIVRADSGTVFIDGRDITVDPMHIRARKGLGYLPQEASVFKKLTVDQNIRAVLEYLRIPRAEQRERSRLILEELGIHHLAQQRASVLSGGERRRLEISRVLATNPSFILLDEPFAGIDPLAVIDIQNIIKHLTKRGLGVLVSDHNVRETLGVCDKAYILNNGSVIEYGPPETIAASETARRIYLGDGFTL
ncbi:MAG: LPS export ABC transporter ATP-binding protein [Thermodesulfobacteriota bacterium]|nr:LPS export ABC transporter ATP-binding protein [Thermodesulfobacteriota bacterium]